jgi:hypothetical protein
VSPCPGTRTGAVIEVARSAVGADYGLGYGLDVLLAEFVVEILDSPFCGNIGRVS